MMAFKNTLKLYIVVHAVKGIKINVEQNKCCAYLVTHHVSTLWYTEHPIVQYIIRINKRPTFRIIKINSKNSDHVNDILCSQMQSFITLLFIHAICLYTCMHRSKDTYSLLL